MGIDLTTLLAGLTGASHGLGVAVEDEATKKRQRTLDAEQKTLHDAQLANLADEQQGRELARYNQGFRTGTAPDVQGLLSALNVGAGMTPGVGAMPSAATLAVKEAASDPRFSPDRFQQVNQGTYVDRTATPEAVAERQAVLRAALTPKAPVTPPRIDPLSPQGIAAQQRIAAYEASLKPKNVGPDGQTLGKPNADNLKNAAFLENARAEDAALEDMGATIGSSAISRIPLLGNMILKHTDPKFQAQQLAGDRWIMQWLRSTSGAAISADELSNYRKQYIPQPGDTPETVAAKARARSEVEKSLAKMAGAAAPQQAPVQHGDTGNVDLRLPPHHVQTIDEMIKAGKSDAEIKAALQRGVH